MRVLVIGGYGLIGGHVVSALTLAGHEVIGAGRNLRGARSRFSQARWAYADLARFTSEDWAPLLEGVEAVVNCAGVLQDNPSDDLEAVHVAGLLTLAKAAHGAGVRRLVHISAAGMQNAPGAFGLTKRAAEAALRAEEIDWVILRPGLVLAPAAFGGSALLRALAGCPAVIPAVYARSLIQVVAAEDIAEAVRLAIDPTTPGRFAVDLVSSEAYPLGDILVAIRAWLGFHPAPVLDMPPALGNLTARLADFLACLGWRSPMRSAALAQLQHGVRGDPNTAALSPVLNIRSLEQWFAASPSGVQERWFARLYFLKPLGIATLFLFWLVSGMIGLFHIRAAAGVLTMAGAPQSLADAYVLAGSAADILLAVLVCHRRTTPLALKGMIAISCAYISGASLWRPDLWSDPLGPLVKVLPSIVLAMVMLAVLEER